MSAAGRRRLPALRRLSLLALAIGTTSLGVARAADAPDAMALLAKAAGAYGDGAAHAAAFSQTYTPSGFTTSKRESGTLWIQAPERLRFDYSAPDVKIFTYDAGEGRFLSPEDKQLTVRKLSRDERAGLPLVFLEKPEELARRYAITLEGSGTVTMKPRAADSELAWLRLAIAPTGVVDALSYQDTSGNRTEFHFDGWKRENPRPAADYRVTGPKGTRVVQN